jgi:hypothetical protein
MATITLRETKGSPLSFEEVDGNFTNLNDGKQEIINSLNTDSTMTSNADYIAYWDSGAGASRKIKGLDTPFFYRTIIIKAIPDANDTYVGDGITAVTIPATFDGLYLYSIGGHVYTAGTGATTDVQLYNLTTAVDVLSTKLTIDAGETDSSTAATSVVINTSGDTNRVYTATVLRIDVDQIASSTAAKGLEIRMEFRGQSS